MSIIIPAKVYVDEIEARVTALETEATPLFADPNADRLVFWDDSASAFAALTPGAAVVISGTTVNISTATETAVGAVELATAAETTTGTDATRAVHPQGLKVELDKKATKNTVEGLVTHDGSAGGGTRPSGFWRVRWVGGTVRPTNMAAGDVWEHDA